MLTTFCTYISAVSCIAGNKASHSLLQVSANPFSSVCCALIAAKHSFSNVNSSSPSHSTPQLTSSSEVTTGNGRRPAQLHESDSSSSLQFEEGAHPRSQAQLTQDSSNLQHSSSALDGAASSTESHQGAEGAEGAALHQQQGYGNGNGGTHDGSGDTQSGSGDANGVRQVLGSLQSQQPASAGNGWRCHGLQGPWSNPVRLDTQQQPQGQQAANGSSDARRSEVDLGIAGEPNHLLVDLQYVEMHLTV